MGGANTDPAHAGSPAPAATAAPVIASPQRFTPALPKGAAVKTISAAKIEKIIARSMGIFGVVFGVQSLPIMLGQLPLLDPVWADAVNLGIFGGLALVAIATVFNRFVRLTTSWVAFCYLLSLVLWPLMVVDPAQFVGQKPWLWFLCTVATACAAVAFTTVWATIYTLAVPVIYGALHTVPAGGDADYALAALDTLYATILGLVVLIIITMLRQAAAAVDVAQTAALGTYSTAVRQHATEVERIEVDAIVHDSVLTTFISAANARTTADKELAASMARGAIARLDAAGEVLPGDDSVVQASQLERRLRAAVATYSASVSITVRDIDDLALPMQVTEAIYSAAVQALINSLQHADGPPSQRSRAAGVTRALSIAGGTPCGVRVVISDTGVGFDSSRLMTGRLGLRVSILERMAAVGGGAVVSSTPGVGTTISLEWPVDEPTMEKPELEADVGDTPTLQEDAE